VTARIDAHQHFWRVARGDYPWMAPALTPLYRDFGPGDLAPLLRATNIEATVLVQAAPTAAETRFLLDIADQTECVVGVVGWADFESPSAPDDIAALAAHPRIVGIRPMIQDIPDDGWILRADLDPAFAAVQEYGLVFDALVHPRHLRNLLKRLARHPELRIVVDHCAKPAIRDGAFEPWATDMAALAAETGAFCKISGLVTEAASDWGIDDLKPYFDHVLRYFGPDRLIWGSDWPVCTLAASYEDWHAAAQNLASELEPSEREAFFGANAAALYRLQLHG
jgi:L-fuconolactonase